MMFQHGFRIVRSRHPLARLLVGLIGLVVFAMLLALGVFALAALVVGGGLFMLVRSLRPSPVSATAAPQSPAPAPGVIEGEFRVVPEGVAPDSVTHRSTSGAH